MNNLKRMLAILFIIVTSNLQSSDVEEIDTPFHALKASNYAKIADEQKARIAELKGLVTSHRPVKDDEFFQIKKSQDEKNPEVKITKKLGFFDTVSNWSTKRTLSKLLTDHAKNNDESAKGIEFSKSQKESWDSLSADDQKDLINQWFKTHKNEKLSDISKNRTKYDNSVDKFSSKVQKEKLAKVAKQESEITDNEKAIAKINDKLEKSDVSNSEKRSLDLDKKHLEEKNKLALEAIEENLSLLKYEQDTRDALYRYNREFIHDYHDKKLNNFIESMNNLEDSKNKISIIKTPKATFNSSEITDQKENKPRKITKEDMEIYNKLQGEARSSTGETKLESIQKMINFIQRSTDYTDDEFWKDRYNYWKNEYKKTEDLLTNKMNLEELNNKILALQNEQTAEYKNSGTTPKFSQLSKDIHELQNKQLEKLKTESQNWPLSRFKEEVANKAYSIPSKRYLNIEIDRLSRQSSL